MRVHLRMTWGGSPRWFEADYVLWHIDEQQIGIFPEGVLAYLRRQPQIYVANYHGIDYTWLYAVPKPAYLTGGSKLEGIAILFGYDVEEKSLTDLSPGDPLKLHLYWQNEGQAAEQQFWWRIVDEEEYIWSEAVQDLAYQCDACHGREQSPDLCKGHTLGEHA